MKKKILILILAISLLIPSAFVLTACGEHQHRYSDFLYDGTKHWRECSCGDKRSENEHHIMWDEANPSGHRGSCHCGYMIDGEHTWNDEHLQCLDCEYSMFEVDEECWDGLRINGFKWIYSDYYTYGEGREEASNLVIPSHLLVDGEDLSVTEIGEYAFAHNSNLTSVTIPNTVTDVGVYAFCDCENLTTVNWSESETIIGTGVFSNCTSLRTITKTSKIEKIGESAFQGSGVEDIFSNQNWQSLKTIGISAFENTPIVTLNVPGSVTTIERDAFGSCENLKKVSILNLNAEIKGAFSDTCCLEEISLPYTSSKEFSEIIGYGNGESVPEALRTVKIVSATEIPDKAFLNCGNIKKIVLPRNLTSVGSDAFKGCGITDFEYNGTLNDWVKITFKNKNANPTSVVGDLKIGGNVVTSANISGADKIGSYSLYNCKSLTSVTISNDARIMGYGVLEGCDNLEELTIPFVGYYRGISRIAKENRLPYIFGDTKFENEMSIPSKLSTVTITDDTELSEAFDECSSLTKVTLPNTLVRISSISRSYFSPGLSSTTELHYAGTIDEWAQISFDTEKSNPIYYTNNLYINNEKVTKATFSATSISENAFVNYTSITEVKFLDTVTTIGAGAFSGCTALNMVEISNGITTISKDAFKGCSGLTKTNYTGTIDEWIAITFTSETSNPIYYSKSLYVNDNKITTLTLSSATSISENAFVNCEGLSEINIENSVTTIGKNAFKGCSKLTKTNYTGTLDEWVQIYFGNEYSNPICYTKELYINNQELTELKLETATSISQYAFYNYDKLVDFEDNGIVGYPVYVTFGNNVKSIGKYAFASSKIYWGKRVRYTGTLSEWAQIQFENSSANPLCYLGTVFEVNGEELTKITANDLKDTTYISNYAFYNCGKITTVTLNDNITSVGKYAFAYCDELSSITLSSGLTEISGDTFYNCVALKSVSIGSNVTTIGESAFEECSNLLSVTLPEAVTTIGKRAFYNCSALTSVTMKNNVTTIGESAFEECSNLLSVTLPEAVTTIGKRAFYNCSALTSVTMKNNVTTIGESAFYGCKAMFAITLSYNLTTIGKSAFSRSGLKNITIPASVTSIGDDAFNSCSELIKVNYTGTINMWTQIKFGNSSSNPATYSENLYINDVLQTEIVITSSEDISAFAFYYNKSLTSVTIRPVIPAEKLEEADDFAIEIRPYAFAYSGVTTVIIGDNVTTISNNAFRDCNGLFDLTIGKDVKKIYYRAFENCCRLITITIPESVTDIGYSTFSGCYSLVEIYNLSNLKITIGNDTDVDVPDYVKDVYTSLGEQSKLSRDANGYIIYTNGVDKILVGYVGTATDLILPTDLTEINKYALYDIGLNSIVIEKNITKLGQPAVKAEYVYFKGTSEEWNSITGAEYALYDTHIYLYFYSETEPTDSGNYWHYGEDGTTPTVWTK